MITIELGEGAITVDETGLYIAGGGNFGGPGDYPLNDDDGDGVWTLTIERPVNFSSFYTFTNGACPDWSCKENIAGQDCANPDNFNDRFMGPITQDTTIATCFGLCYTSTDCSDPNAGDITFEVDMNSYANAFTTVYLSGTMNGWSGDANPLSDDDGDGVWTTTLPLNGGQYEYKFQVDGWADQELFNEGDPCTVTNGGFTNRFMEVMGDASVCWIWNTCSECSVGTNDLDYADNLFEVRPTLVQNETQVLFGANFTDFKTLHVFNAIGQLVEAVEIPAGTDRFTLDAAQLEDGLYFINVETQGMQQTQRIIVNRK
ncbi:MAG: T9SS C-terminal target domain-containing protein [Bacteroidetes bacterium]|nr:MAG: T9SS C-terminal target domain-containing protein [Bacteroidota bacterium]